MDWEEIWKVERDICYLYHMLAEYAGIADDITGAPLYLRPYWDFLNLDMKMHDFERTFVRDGCLVILFSMALDVVYGSGTYILQYLDPCQKALEGVVIDNEKTQRLVETVALAFKAVEKIKDGTEKRDVLRPDLEDLSIWVSGEYVRGYFEGKAAEVGAAHRRLSAANAQR